MPGPHATWAEVYEQVCSATFGADYRRMTDKTMKTVARLVQPPARIVDFGAGAGRIALPLAQCGYAVTAVDPSSEMLEELQNRRRGANPRCVHSSIRNFTTTRPFDMALCVFTVLVYILDDEELDASIRAMSRALAADATLLIDVPAEGLFQSFIHEDETVRREVRVEEITPGRYTYSERIHIADLHGGTTYADEFPIRHWPLAQVVSLLQQHGLDEEEDVSRYFAGTGSHYLLLRKRDLRTRRPR